MASAVNAHSLDSRFRGNDILGEGGAFFRNLQKGMMSLAIMRFLAEFFN
jgi:hypothetical protein